MSGNMENYSGMKGYENGSKREEGEGKMCYLRGKDTAEGYEAVNPSFLQEMCFFILLPRAPFSFHFAPLLIIHT